MMKRGRNGLFRDQQGAILVEALVVLPFMIVLVFVILEFGNMLWQRLQVQTGVREAARYWSRCPDDFSSCSETIARNIAFYGHPLGSSGGTLRMPGWDDASELTMSPDKASLPAIPTDADIVSATGVVPFHGWFLNDRGITINVTVEMRYIGW